MNTSVQHQPIPDQPGVAALRPEALDAVQRIHDTVRTWAPESEYTLTENSAEFPVLFGRCTLSVMPLCIDTYDGFRLSERVEARTELSYVIDDFDETFFHLANTYATTGTVLRCPNSGRAVIASAANVLREDADALQSLYVPTLLWSSLVQSFSVQKALIETFGTDFLGDRSELIGMDGCDESSRWRTEEFVRAKDMLRSNGVYSSASETSLTVELPWELGAMSALVNDNTCLLQFDSGARHPTAGNGLAFRLVLPTSDETKDINFVQNTLNEMELGGIDMPPSFGAWAALPQFNSVGYVGFWPNCMYRPGTVANIASWCALRSRIARQVIGNKS